MHIEEAMKQHEFFDRKEAKNSTKINLFIHVGCLTERLIRNSAIEDYPEKDKFQKLQKGRSDTGSV